MSCSLDLDLDISLPEIVCDPMDCTPDRRVLGDEEHHRASTLLMSDERALLMDFIEPLESVHE